MPKSIAAQISPARSRAVAARVGLVLGLAIAVCFLTGLISHWIQHPPAGFYWPARPVWLYRFTQGTHVISGVIAIALLPVKLWSVFPRLFARPLLGNPLHMLERGSIAILMGAIIFELATGLLNTAQWYPWRFFFTTTHYAMAYVAIGAVAVHLAVKLPVIRAALSRPLSEREPEQDGSRSRKEPKSPAARGISRRNLLGIAGGGAVVGGLAVAGQAVPFLRWVSVLAARTGDGPQGVPVNRAAVEAGVERAAKDPGYRLRVTVGGKAREFGIEELRRMTQTGADLPIACVEGWSAGVHWSGVRLRDLLGAVGEYRGGSVRFGSLEQGGLYRESVLPHPHVVDDATLVALRLNGEELSLDHGYPCRLIAPNRPGVLQTKWLSRIEELA
ncbi:molybdopterin-dependent oxidoreductase [Nocardia terpenica]|uniref:Molybdopterin-binding protein n=1 Tax=Nocardia terpenica TaxID=455432 RepID=A0A164JDP5_9NOCA|nr:molybdopterin-dependent oxidoreductase [Nocardia terpenica]KZM70300.1 molybdopterin-binding protein [Nocardia terpenica]